MQYRVLGPLCVLDDHGSDITPAGDRQRRLLAALLLDVGSLVAVDRLAEVLWPDELPADRAGALQTHVFRLRRALPEGSIDTVAGSYRLNAGPEDVDAPRFAAAVAEATSCRVGVPEAALARLTEALTWWRGEPYEDLVDTDAGRVESQRLCEVHALACEERLAALVDLGRSAEALADLHALVAAHPLRERPCALLMTALQASGRSAEATRAYDGFRRRLAEELGLDPSDSLRRLNDDVLQGVEQPASPRPGPDPADEAAPGAAAPAAPAPALARGRPSVPAAPTSLVGRDELVEDVLERLERQRLVTLIGTGGVGKTRVALEVARRLAAGPGPVWFCELAVADGASVELVVAGTLGVEQGSSTSLLGRVTDALRAEPGTLILDNCEHVLDSVAGLADAVLAGCPEAQLLATSRERLSVGGEHLCPVPPFPVAHDDLSPDEPALRLFAERAAAVRPGFALDAATLPVVVEICRRLDGLPLALELAAARLHAMELHEVAAGLDRRFRILTSGPRAVPRQRSLAATVAWSYDLLEPEARRTLDALGAFAGPFPARAAAAVADLDEDATADAIVALVDRSLVQRTGDGRFLLLETLKHFAVDRLTDSGQLAAVRRRHALWALAEAKAGVAKLVGPEGAGVLAALDEMLGELRAAHRHFVDGGDAEHAIELVEALFDFGFQRLRPEVHLWATEAAELGRAVAHPATPSTMAIAGFGLWERGDLDGALRHGHQGLALAEQLGVAPDYFLIDLFGVHALVTGQLEEAVRWLDRAIADTGPRATIVRRTISRGVRVQTAAYAGWALAEQWADELLADLGPGPTGHGAYAWYAAAEAIAARDPDVARRWAQRAVDDSEAVGAWFVTGVAGALAASLDVRSGDRAAAVATYRWVLPWWRRAGVWSVLGTVLRPVAQLLADLGRDHAAAVLLGAVTAEGSGHSLYGADARDLADLAVRLEARLGGGAYAAAVTTGRALDVDAAAAAALAELDDSG